MSHYDECRDGYCAKCGQVEGYCEHTRGSSVRPAKPTSPPTGPPPTPPPAKDTRDGRVPKPSPAFDPRACLCPEGRGTHAQCPVLGHPGHPRASGECNQQLQEWAQLLWPNVRLPRTIPALRGTIDMGVRLRQELRTLDTALKRFQQVLDETLEEMP